MLLLSPKPLERHFSRKQAPVMADSISPHSQNILFLLNIQPAELYRPLSWGANDMLSTQEQMFL